MSRLLARLVPPVLVMGLVVALWHFILRFSLDRAAAALAGLTP
jgi:hypothetical protein